MRPVFYLVTGVLILVLVACAGFENIEVGEIEEIKFNRFADRSVEFEVLMPIDNPSSFRFRIVDVDLDVHINNEYIGKIRNVDNVSIPSGSSEVYTFPLRVEFSNILRGALSMYNVLLMRKAEVSVEGHITVRSFPLTRRLKVDEVTRIDFN